MPTRCRLCTTNDRDALVDELAAEMWELRRDSAIDPAWADASSYWREIFHGFAEATIRLLEREHG